MAEINLLKAGYKGKLGDTTGAQWKDKYTIRSKIWSKAPPTEVQTKNVRAFEKLNRLASGIARTTWNYLPLNDKKMLKHNAVAKWLKPVIRNKKFEPQNAEEIIGSGEQIRIYNFTKNLTSSTLNIKIRTNNNVPDENKKIVTIIFNAETGNVIHGSVNDYINTNETIWADMKKKQVYQVIAFVSEKHGLNNYTNSFRLKKEAGMQYTLEEQMTQDVWIDGRPIYQKTWQITTPTVPSGSSIDITLPDTGIDYAISDEVVFDAKLDYIQRSTGEIVVVNSQNSQLYAGFVNAYMNMSDGRMRLNIGAGNQTIATRISSTTAIVTLRYVKKSDIT